MAFCKQCGTDLNGARFCPSCGTAADTEMVAAQSQNVAPIGADVRQRSLADLDHMLRYFGVKQAQYDEYDSVTEEVERRRQKSYLGLILTGVAICILVCIFTSGDFFGVLCLGLFLASPFVVTAILLGKGNKKKLNTAMVKQSALATELNDYYTAYGYCPVGMEYTNPKILYKINDIIRMGRANNPGDAINLLLDDIHKAEMERQAAATTAAAEETARQSKKAAKSAKKAAGYASASFWFK